VGRELVEGVLPKRIGEKKGPFYTDRHWGQRKKENYRVRWGDGLLIRFSISQGGGVFAVRNGAQLSERQKT